MRISSCPISEKIRIRHLAAERIIRWQPNYIVGPTYDDGMDIVAPEPLAGAIYRGLGVWGGKLCAVWEPL